ncbi:acyl-CoA dehydrogenase [Mycobacterium sp. Root265]|uniref:acyl-CoA dehydrogenase family protein n=1 Tax=Mycobacterium sp. Root265 TaxID=1736504 RepID=UPI000708B18D|nr:acyl-CoA dehydrogenase family protein [Mycobacterium sp. Root265]KRD05748.1 acyl-CoA dehydrogenase [Mycobacterium sp. Root265]
MPDSAAQLGPDTSSPQAFTESAHRFLSAHAERTHDQGVTWGSGSDRVSYFASGTAEQEHEAVQAARRWQGLRYGHGWGWITGPQQYGGLGLSVAYQLLYQRAEEEYVVPDTSQLSVVGLGMVGPTVLAHGQQELRDALLPRMYRGEAVACQLFSEPAAGSDLAGVQSRAVRDGDNWIINGQKVWTSAAQHSDVGEILCRTDLDAPKHKGLTAFMIDMKAPGVEIRPLRQMTGGSEFNEVFLTDVRVPDGNRLGEVDGGWAVALTTLTAERDVVAGVDSPEVARALTSEHLSALMRATYTWDDRSLRRQLAALLAEARAVESLNAMAARKIEAGQPVGPERSVAKLVHARNITRAAHFVSEVLGPRIIADSGQWGTFAWSDLLLASPALRILGGTEEIMKNILGEQVLGLPKEPAATIKTTPTQPPAAKGAQL